MGTGFTRSRFLKALGAGYLALLGAGGCARRLGSLRIPEARPLPVPKVWPLVEDPPVLPRGVWAFRSRPDLGPASVEVTAQARDDEASGYVFVALKEGAGEHGPMILDGRGQPVWFEKYTTARDFKVQFYRGEPVLTWWEGKVFAGHGVGEYVIFDDSYREVARVRAGNGYRGGDLHEFLITPQDTALLVAYAPARTNLSPIGGPKDGMAWEGIVQEMDIQSGEVIFEWHSLEHVGIEESYIELPEDPDFLYDYFHINSIDVEPD